MPRKIPSQIGSLLISILFLFTCWRKIHPFTRFQCSVNFIFLRETIISVKITKRSRLYHVLELGTMPESMARPEGTAGPPCTHKVMEETHDDTKDTIAKRHERWKGCLETDCNSPNAAQKDINQAWCPPQDTHMDKHTVILLCGVDPFYIALGGETVPPHLKVICLFDTGRFGFTWKWKRASSLRL